MSYIIPRALYFDSAVPDQPNWDVLIGVCNPYKDSQTVEFHFFDLSGDEVPKSPLTYELLSGHSIATTLIRKNIFPDPPQNFQGYCEVKFPGVQKPFGVVPGQPLPIMSCLGGNGPTPLNWNYSTANVPVLNTLQADSGLGFRWVFPYLIPYFRDAKQHFDEHEYRTGLSITNLKDEWVHLSMKYTVGDIYPNAGAEFVVPLTIAPKQTLVRQIHELLPDILNFNSEGWLDIRELDGRPANLAMYLLCANRDYQYLGWGQVPWVI